MIDKNMKNQIVSPLWLIIRLINTMGSIIINKIRFSVAKVTKILYRSYTLPVMSWNVSRALLPSSRSKTQKNKSFERQRLLGFFKAHCRYKLGFGSTEKKDSIKTGKRSLRGIRQLSFSLSFSRHENPELETFVDSIEIRSDSSLNRKRRFRK